MSNLTYYYTTFITAQNSSGHTKDEGRSSKRAKQYNGVLGIS
jgi:hypothetical protein